MSKSKTQVEHKQNVKKKSIKLCIRSMPQFWTIFYFFFHSDNSSVSNFEVHESFSTGFSILLILTKW